MGFFCSFVFFVLFYKKREGSVCEYQSGCGPGAVPFFLMGFFMLGLLV